jgi:hypothetical protein
MHPGAAIKVKHIKVSFIIDSLNLNYIKYFTNPQLLRR